ncbi:hypothetical protein LZ32DRAFT_660323 [Colletotrichum eremochloae]|nr:hypothetical protein LZ32DRAFT_660323 [Colletotrichum eremochloae]
MKMPPPQPDPSKRPSHRDEHAATRGTYGNRANRDKRDDQEGRDNTAESMSAAKALLRRRIQEQQQREQQQQKHQSDRQRQQQQKPRKQSGIPRPSPETGTPVPQRHGPGLLVVVLQSISSFMRGLCRVVSWAFGYPRLVVVVVVAASAVLTIFCLVADQAPVAAVGAHLVGYFFFRPLFSSLPSWFMPSPPSSSRSSAYGNREVLPSVAPSFPSFSDGISNTAVIVANVISGDPDYVLYITPSVMPAHDVLENVDLAVQAFLQRLLWEQGQYLKLIRRTENSPLGQRLRTAWFWAYSRQQTEARDAALRRGRDLAELIEAALGTRSTLVDTLTSRQTLQATLHVSRNTCGWAKMLEKKPQIAANFANRHTLTMEQGRADEPTSRDVQVRVQDLATTEILRARVLCSGSNVMANSWKRLEEHVVRRDIEDLLSARVQVQHLLEQLGSDPYDLDPNGLDEWEARLVEIPVQLLTGMCEVYGRYSEA